MILYALYHGGHLPIAIVHKMTVHPEEEAVLLVGNAYERHIGAAMDLSRLTEVFSRVICYKEIYGKTINEPKEIIEQEICKEYDNHFMEEKVDFAEFTTIYNIPDAQDSLGIYLSILNIPWTVLEDNQGKFMRFHNKPTTVYDLNAFSTKTYADILYERQIYQVYTNPLITGISIDQFNYVMESNKLSEEEKNKILYMYHMDDIPSTKCGLFLASSKAALVGSTLNKNMAYKRYFTLTDQAYFASNATILDITTFSKQRFDIKPHPSVPKILSNEEEIFSYPRYFPAEFMPFLPHLNYSTLIGHSSLSVDNLPKLIPVQKVISYSTTFARQAHLFYRLYLTYVLCNSLFSGEFSSFGITKELFEDIDQNADIDFPMNEKYTPLKDLKTNVPFTVINNSSLKKPNYQSMLIQYIQKSAAEDVIAVINSEDDFAFVHEDYDFSDIIVPVYIDKEVTQSHAVGNFQRETIYFFCKSKQIREKIHNFQYSREFYYTGITLSVQPASQESLSLERQQLQLRRMNLLQLKQIKELSEKALSSTEESLSAQTETLSKKIGTLESTLISQQEFQFQERQKQVSKDKTQAEEELQQLPEEKKQVQEERKQVHKDRIQSQEERQQLQADRKQLQEDRKQFQEDRQQLQEERKQLLEELKILTKQNQEQQSEIHKLKHSKELQEGELSTLGKQQGEQKKLLEAQKKQLKKYSVYDGLDAEGYMLSAIHRFNEKYPMGSNKRKRMKKIAKFFLGK